MFSAAQIIFNKQTNPTNLDLLLAILARSESPRVTKTQWVGHGISIPQLLVETTPPFTIQIDDDPDYVPEEIAEIAEDEDYSLSQSQRERLRQCRVRLDIMSTESPPRIETSSMIFVVAQASLDPTLPDVAAVIETLAKHLGGFVLDCINGGVREPLA